MGISKSAGWRNLEVTTGSVQFNRSTAAALMSFALIVRDWRIPTRLSNLSHLSGGESEWIILPPMASLDRQGPRGRSRNRLSPRAAPLRTMRAGRTDGRMRRDEGERARAGAGGRGPWRWRDDPGAKCDNASASVATCDSEEGNQIGIRCPDDPWSS